jgi:hypothetical protein
MTIAEILKELKSAKPEMRVYYDFANCIPTRVDSWRGVYAEPALGWEPSGYSAAKQVKYPTVADLIKEIEQASNSKTVYSGWKGGDFTYTPNLPLHVDNPGDCTNTEIVRVEVNEYQIVLHTQTIEPVY